MSKKKGLNMASHSFAEVPTSSISRSSFRRSCGYKTGFDSGYLVPFFCDEVLPGDTFNLDLALFARMSTPVVPVMDNIYLETFFFFVPNRLVWDNFKRQMGEQDKPGQSIDVRTPQISFKSPEGFSGSVDDLRAAYIGSTADYFGLPPSIVGTDITVNALPFRAAKLCYNEWFRDENLQDSLEINKGDVEENFFTYSNGQLGFSTPLMKRRKHKDYLSGALPWPQKFAPNGVQIALGATVPIVPNGPLTLSNGANSFGLAFGTVNNVPSVAPREVAEGSVVGDSASSAGTSSGDYNKLLAYESGLSADLSSMRPITINDLRQAFMMQRLLETDARSGTRYTSVIRAHFDTICPDFRLQRPEYLGGSSGLINIHQVAQTSSSDQITPQGNLAAYGIYSDTHNGFVKSFCEHGYVIGFVNVRTDLSYQQGIERHWSKKTRYDYYWPALAHLGEQAVLNKEIFVDGTEADEEVFGYQERYGEYRYKPSLVTGKLRSGTGNSLDVWHLSQWFNNRPVLNSEFIEENPPIERALAVQNEPEFILDAWFSLNSVRPMPVHGIPGFMSHF